MMVWIIVLLGLVLMVMEWHRMTESFRNDRQIIRGDGWEAVDKDDNYNFE